METQDVLLSRNAAERHLAADFTSADRAAIFTTSGMFTQEFTGDRPTLLKALGGISARYQRPSNPCNETTYYIADHYRNLHDPDADQLLTAQATECVPSNLPTTDLQAAIQSLKNSITMTAVAHGEMDARRSLYAAASAIQRLSTMPGDRSLVLVSPGFLSRERTVEKSDLMERAVKARVTINALDTRGVATFAASAEARPQLGGGMAQSLRRQLDSAAAAEEGQVLGELADGSGGAWIHNTNDLVSGFRTAASPPEVLYVLAFSPQNLRYDGRFHSLKVTVSGQYSIQARRGYYAPSHLADAAEQAKEEVREAVFSREDVREISLDVRTQFFKPDEVSARVTVLAQFDAQQLKYRKADGRNNDVLTMVAALFDRDGKWVSGNEKTLTMRLKDDTLASRTAGALSLRSTFSVIPGLYQIRVVLRDSEGQQMAAKTVAVDVP